MQDITILCNSSYQIMVAFYIIKRYFRKDRICLLISDKINDSENMIKNIRQYHMVDRAASVNTDELKKAGEHKLGKFIFHSAGKNRLKRYLANCTEKLPENCDIFLCSNIELFSIAFCKVYRCEMQLFEDGIATYSMEMGDFYKTAGNFIERNRQKRYDCYMKVTQIYLFTPEYLIWEPPFRVEKLDSFIKDKEFIEQINIIFSFDKNTENYEKPYIFFEEAYSTDGRKVEDMAILKKVMEIVGVENVLVKRHPRNKKNRFEKSGYHVNQNIGLPWEVVALNMDLKDKTVITIASAAAVTPNILFGKEMNVILLYNMYPDAPLKRDVLEVLKYICETQKVFLLPEGEEELAKILFEIEEKREHDEKIN